MPTIEKKHQINCEEDLLELDDDEDDHIIKEYRNKRMAEMKANLLVPRFGEVREITAPDYVEQVNKAGDNIWVVLLLYQSGYQKISYIAFYNLQCFHNYHINIFTHNNLFYTDLKIVTFC